MPNAMTAQAGRAVAGDASLPLQVDGARKRYGQVEALAGASLDVRPGELLGLLGPNGAGKTTLIRAISGRVRLDAGTVRLFGRVLDGRDARPEIGVVPQELAIYPNLTARENLQVFGRLYGVVGADLQARVGWALEWSDLADRANEPVRRFSGGMKRRLNIACGLLHSPAVVLLDEPTVGVDPQSRERIYDMLTALQRSGVSVVLTTHHLEEAEQRCERIVIIDAGRIVAAGSLDELVRKTLGDSRVLRLALDEPWSDEGPVPAGVRLSQDRRTLETETHDVAAGTAAVFDAVARAGRRITDMRLTGATLHEVFIALTGRELRE
jgi:ABC-2 type transport system ATP-binding protein